MECSFVRVPIDWRRFDVMNETNHVKSESPTTLDWICVHVKRLKSLSSEKKGQLWIHNTPLFEFHKTVSVEVEELFLKESIRYKDYDIYFPDIRGLGKSTPKFVCEFEEQSGHVFISEKDIDACLATNTKNEKIISEKYGEYFHTYQIVRDIFHMIEMTRVENGGESYRIIHYGYGFNTFLIGRMIQLEKELKLSFLNKSSKSYLDMVIVDSVFSMNVSTIDMFNFDKRFNEIALSFLEECDKDKYCTEKLDLLHKIKGKVSLRTLLNGIYLIHLKRCYIANSYFFRDILTYFYYEDDLRHLLIPLIFRISRCNELDKNVIQDFFYHINHTMITTENSHTKLQTYSAFERVIGSFELMDHSFKFYKEEETGALDLAEYPFYSGLSLNMMKTYSLFFHSPHSTNHTNNTHSHFTDFSKPMLMLHGSLDPISSINNLIDWKDFYLNESKANFENHHAVTFPYVNHITTLKSYCSLEVMHTFIQSLGREYFNECLLESTASDQIRSQLFNESNWSEQLKNTTLIYFGTKDALDGGLSISASNYYFLVVGMSVSGVLLIELFVLLIILLVMSIKELK
ncbi:predicted protein [Naegleria gruberi]|uniref:Predicted protein n=1 Tax=Naegleria gruberi TaxID=5762 RepID=D2V6S7_NAEGR|nr:uncharacterized protein NAEGRDRAFT_47119 [Naegleria gruberi]EFC47495.1 predicted protein [Naegleria gruberi]|eukprot:XP_002680239.1 predicted protein [Naegleria gruberi strain NEG-M]